MVFLLSLSANKVACAVVNWKDSPANRSIWN
jgi:hypothetical protein